MIKDKAFKNVALKEEFDHMKRAAGGREVSLVIYESLEVMKAKGTTMTLGRELGEVR